jgi:hypothetical protein
MEFIDKTKVSEQERLTVEANAAIEDLVRQKQDKVSKAYIPTQENLEYLRSFRKGLYNREGKSKGGTFAIVASFPEAVHIDMTNKHGAGWFDKPGILTEFLQKNPCYRIGQPQGGFDGAERIEVKENANASV